MMLKTAALYLVALVAVPHGVAALAAGKNIVFPDAVVARQESLTGPTGPDGWNNMQIKRMEAGFIEDGPNNIGQRGFIEDGPNSIGQRGFIEDGPNNIGQRGFIEDGPNNIGQRGFIEDGPNNIGQRGFIEDGPNNIGQKRQESLTGPNGPDGWNNMQIKRAQAGFIEDGPNNIGQKRATDADVTTAAPEKREAVANVHARENWAFGRNGFMPTHVPRQGYTVSA